MKPPGHDAHDRPASPAESDAVGEATARLLGEIGLATCRYALRREGDAWRIDVTTELDGTRINGSVTVEHHRLYASLDDAATFDALRHAWSAALAHCGAR